MKPQDHVPSSTFHIAHTKNNNMATASLLTEIMAYFTACTPHLEVAISCIFYTE
jgi:hypothetical protein